MSKYNKRRIKVKKRVCENPPLPSRRYWPDWGIDKKVKRTSTRQEYKTINQTVDKVYDSINLPTASYYTLKLLLLNLWQFDKIIVFVDRKGYKNQPKQAPLIVKKLLEAGYIREWKGHTGRGTIIKLKEKYDTMSIPLPIYVRNMDLKKYKLTGELAERAEVINQYNRRALKVNVCGVDGTPIRVQISARYVHDFELQYRLQTMLPNPLPVPIFRPAAYGRLYTRGGEVQKLSENERKKLLIDSEPVVELDYSGISLAILYDITSALKHIDPYVIRGYPRDIVKKIIVTALNAKSEEDTLKSILSARCRVKNGDRKFRKLCHRHKIPKKIEYFEKLLNKVKNHHEPIAHWFCTGAGALTQYLDSLIAIDVLKNGLEDGIFIIPIHDSFIVKTRHKNWLFNQMQVSYTKIIGRDSPNIHP